MPENQEPSGVSRRTIAKGVAWAIPTVPIVVATPAYASSGNPPTVEVGDVCKLPGSSCNEVFVKGYIFEVTVSNETNKDQYLFNETGYLITITEDSADIDLFFQAAVDADTGEVIMFPYLLEAGETRTLIFNAGTNQDSQNVQNVTGQVCVPWGHTSPAGSDPDMHPDACGDFFFDATPPEQGAQCALTIPSGCGETPA